MRHHPLPEAWHPAHRTAKGLHVATCTVDEQPRLAFQLGFAMTLEDMTSVKALIDVLQGWVNLHLGQAAHPTAREKHFYRNRDLPGTWWKIHVIKSIRERLFLGLADAKALAEQWEADGSYNR